MSSPSAPARCALLPTPPPSVVSTKHNCHWDPTIMDEDNETSTSTGHAFSAGQGEAVGGNYEAVSGQGEAAKEKSSPSGFLVRIPSHEAAGFLARYEPTSQWQQQQPGDSY